MRWGAPSRVRTAGCEHISCRTTRNLRKILCEVRLGAPLRASRAYGGFAASALPSTTHLKQIANLSSPLRYLFTPSISALPKPLPLTPHSSLLTPNSSLLTPNSSLLTPHSYLLKISNYLKKYV